MRTVVTGAAGFVGSHLCEALLARGHEVVGIDSFSSYYDVSLKEDHVAGLVGNPGFRLIRADLNDLGESPYLDRGDIVFHLAAQPGVRRSFREFRTYVESNVMATNALLDACAAARVRRVVYASSSSVYGNASTFPTRESDATHPVSPYGVTKLSAEQLVHAYGSASGFETVALRYFTVYGPRQRPDMATNRLIESALHRQPFPLYGDGSQVREFTYVSDVVRATVAAGEASVPDACTLNVAGGAAIGLMDLIALVSTCCGSEPILERKPAVAGDVERTGGGHRPGLRPPHAGSRRSRSRRASPTKWRGSGHVRIGPARRTPRRSRSGRRMVDLSHGTLRAGQGIRAGIDSNSSTRRSHVWRSMQSGAASRPISASSSGRER